MVTIRLKSVTPNFKTKAWDTVMPARGYPRYDSSPGCSGTIELEIVVSEEEDLMERASQILHKLNELDFAAVELIEKRL